MSKIKPLDSNADQQETSVSGRAIVLRSLAIFLPVLALIFAVTIALLLIREKTERTFLCNKEQHVVSIQASSIDADIESVASDLAILTHETLEAPLWNTDEEVDPDALASLAQHYLSFSTHRKLYDQIRLLDEQGMEVVRVNFNNGHPAVVPVEDLQNKQGRYYFDDAFELNRGEVFVSPMDLNIEHGKIEKPLKPMIRFATPIFDQTGRKRGIVLLNYFGAQLLERFDEQVNKAGEGQAMLLNADGYWLNGPVPADEWGFMYENRKNRTFSTRFPEAWKKIQGGEFSQFETPKGLFTFRTVYPLLEGQKSSTGSGRVVAQSDMPLKAKDYSWKVVSFTPVEALYAAQNGRREMAALIFGGLALALGFAVWRIAGTVALRKQAETALKESESRYRSLFESSRDAMMTLTPPSWGFSSGNPAAVEMFGAQDADDFASRAPWEYSPSTQPDGQPSHEKAEAMIKRAMREGSNFFEWKHKRLNGEEFLATVLLTRVEFSGQTLLQATVRDITERRQAEQAFRESEKKYRKIIEASRDGYVAVKGNGEIVMTNASFANMLGYSEEEMKELDWIEFTPAKWREEELGAQAMKLVERGYTDLYQKEYIHKDGHVFPVEVQAYVLERNESFDSTLIGSFVRDITERRAAEAERVRLMAAIEQLAETVVITDLDGKIEYVNPAFEKITGYTSEEAIGQNPRILQSGAHDAEFYKAMWETLLRGEVWSGQFVNKKKDGEFYTEDATISSVRDASGRAVHYVAVKRDVTEEINMEEQFRQAQKMQSIGQLVAGIAHDFNNLMQIINGYADMARKRLPSGHEAGESVDQIRKAGDQAKNLVKQLLAFSRQQVIDPVDLDLNELIQNSWKMLRHMIGEHIQFEFEAGENLGTVFADRGQMQQVLMNLCVNAHDAMPNGGTLTVQTEKMAIGPDDLKAHAWAQPGNYILLSVRDTGCGMSEEAIKLVFEPFFTTKEVGEGTGLGLSTVYGIIKQNEGHIDAESEPGEGATFKIYLPVSNPLSEKTQDAISENTAFVEGGIETILVAEDEEVVLGLATHILSEAGYTVLAAKDGEEAVRVFEERADEIDCVMMDVVMPRMGGKEAMEKILKKRPALRHLFVSGYSPDAGHTDFIKKEGLRLLNKPYDPNALLQKIREVLDED